jgi:hypothetical protein
LLIIVKDKRKTGEVGLPLLLNLVSIVFRYLEYY